MGEEQLRRDDIVREICSLGRATCCRSPMGSGAVCRPGPRQAELSPKPHSPPYPYTLPTPVWDTVPACLPWGKKGRIQPKTGPWCRVHPSHHTSCLILVGRVTPRAGGGLNPFEDPFSPQKATRSWLRQERSVHNIFLLMAV